MAQTDPSSETIKEAIAEILCERRDFWHELFVEVMEGFALAEAIREGHETDLVERNEVFNVLEGNS